MGEFSEWIERVEIARIALGGEMVAATNGESFSVNGNAIAIGRAREIMARALYYETRDNLDPCTAFQVGYLDSLTEGELGNGVV